MIEFNTTTANITNLISNTRYNISVAANGAVTKMGELSLAEEITSKYSNIEVIMKYAM